MSLELVLQLESEAPGIPGQNDFASWADAALLADEDTEVVIRVVDEAESAQLNHEYRHKQGPTNVLSFPFEAPEEVPLGLLGDLVICAPVIAREAKEQNKAPRAHWAHMVVHGMLHLQGYDHQTDEEADEMESLETRIMTGMGFPPPYELAE